MTNEQLIEEALERFKEEFSWNKAPVTTHDDSGNKITPEPLIYEQLEFLKKELSTIASKSAENGHKHKCPYCGGMGWTMGGFPDEPTQDMCERCEGNGEASCKEVDDYFSPKQEDVSDDDLPF